MYGKLFVQMYDGTLATKGPWQALVTFQQLVILADKHGVVDITAEAIARRTTIPLGIIQEGLQRLQEPDPESRSPDEEGRRITRLSDSRAWGWQIVNYDHYRKIRSAEERREYLKKYQRERRAKNKPVNQNVNMSTSGTQCQPIAVSSKQKHKYVAASRGKTPIPDGWKPKPETLQNLSLEIGADAGRYVDHFIDACRAKDYRYKDFDAAFRKCVRQDWPKLRDKPQQRADGLAL